MAMFTNPRCSRRCYVICVLIIIFMVCWTILYWTYRGSPSLQTRLSPERYLRKFGPRLTSPRARKKVLLWTKAFNEDWTEGVRFQDCPVSACDVTSSKEQLGDSDAVIFHLSNLDLLDLPLTPRGRGHHQAWVLYNLESPLASRGDFSAMAGIFNWTMSYRRDADIVAPYGQAVRLSVQERREQLAERSWTKRNRSRLAVWVASNCNDKSGRKEVVRELARHMPVDTFGACGEGKLPERCGRMADTFCLEVLGDYKFILAFENAICRDYVTEKVWNALRREQVPVVLGGEVEYSALLPPNSFLSLAQFPHPRALALHLMHLAANPQEYYRHFAWREEFRVGENPQWCSLCAALHAPPSLPPPAQTYTDLKSWVFTDLPSCGTL